MLLRSLAALGVTFACVSAASAQTIYEPVGHVSTPPRHFRANDPAMATAGAGEMVDPYSYLDRNTDLQDREYLTLPPQERDAYIWSIVQQKLESHLDYAFSYESRVPPGTPRILVDDQHPSLNDVYNARNARLPRYFRKADLMRAGTVAADGSRTVAADAKPMPMMNGNGAAPAQQTTKPVTAPKPILIIPKNTLPKEPAKPSDKQVAVAK